MSDHIVGTYDEELKELHIFISKMGKSVCSALDASCNDLIKGKKKSVEEVIEKDSDAEDENKKTEEQEFVELKSFEVPYRRLRRPQSVV